jgi:prolyl-tRNA synthetase
MAKEGDLYPETGERYEVFAASEVGNIFPLGIKFTSAFEYTAVDHNGEEKEVYMGSYGIGTSRLMGILVEIFNDKNGIIWPKNVAPYHVHLVTLGDNPKHMQEAEEIYSMLWGDSIEVLWDDREDSSAGEKFADADLIGCPIRLVLSKRSLDKGGVELKKRDSDESEIVSTGELADRIKELLA